VFKHYTFSLFFKANLLLTTLLYLAFLSFNKQYSLLSFILSFMGSISTAVTLVLIVYILFFALRFLKTKGLYVLGFVFLLLNLSLIVDFFIHRLYNFHINAMVINIMTSPAAADSIQLGLAPYLAVLAIITFLVAFEIVLIKKLSKMDAEVKEKRNKKLNKFIILPLFLVILIEKVSFGLATAYSKNEITSKFAVIPLYQPLTFNRLMYKKFGVKPKTEASTVTGGSLSLNYPLEKLSYDKNAKKTNIFIFASDAVRKSVISKEVTPNVFAFSKESTEYTNHMSGGNATRFGVFSLMYGLNSTYWFKFLSASKGSVLFEGLEGLEYSINISSSTKTLWPEFRKTCYVDVVECIQDEYEGTPAQKDLQSTQGFTKWLDKQDLSKPLFSFLFWDAPHGRSYSEEHKIFLPDGDGKTNYLSLDENVAKTILFNQYKNAVHFNDALFGEMIQVLKDKGLYEDSIIIFTSDHGEEFYEFGEFGHNTSFSKAQINSPFIIKYPHEEPKVINHLSSHVDVVPTLLKYIGVSTPPSSYSNGYDMRSPEYKRDYAFIANWNYNAIYTDKATMVFSNLPNKIFNNEVRYSDTYVKIDKDKQNIDSTLILKVLDENRKFLQ